MKLVAINGSLRSGSTNGALLRAAASVMPDGVEVIHYDAVGELPHFNPDLDEEGMEVPAAVRALRELLISARGVLISSPEYAHGVPGCFKNLLDWLVSVGELVGMPVALLNASASGGEYAQAAIRETLRTMNWSVIDDASLTAPFLTSRIRGELTDDRALQALRVAMAAFVAAVKGS